jgi:hypothetical protein
MARRWPVLWRRAVATTMADVVVIADVRPQTPAAIL